MKVFPFAVALLGASLIGFIDATGMQFGCDCGNGSCETDDCCDDCCECDDPVRGRKLEGNNRKLDIFLRHGKCCNYSGETQYALIDIPPCQWVALADGACTGGWTSHDCEGMTCGGGFYKVSGSSTGSCVTPGKDGPPYDKRRWTPDEEDCNAKSPSDICPKVSDTPPGGFEYGPRPECKRMLLRTSVAEEVEPICGGCNSKVELTYDVKEMTP